MADSILEQSMVVFQTRVRALALTDIPDANVLVQKVPRDGIADLPATTPFPCVLIAPFGSATLNPQAGTNLSHDIGFPVQILLLDGDNVDQNLHRDRNFYWYEQIIDKIHKCRTGLTQVRNVIVEPGPIVDPGGWTRGKYVSGIKAIVTARKMRIA